MRPRMHRNLVALHVLLDEHVGALDDARADDEERRLEVFLGEVVEEFPTRFTSAPRFLMQTELFGEYILGYPNRVRGFYAHFTERIATHYTAPAHHQSSPPTSSYPDTPRYPCPSYTHHTSTTRSSPRSQQQKGTPRSRRRRWARCRGCRRPRAP